MSRQAKVDLNSHSQLGIFGLVAFDSKGAVKPKWTQIGTAKRDRQGYLDLSFDNWPSNVEHIQIRPLE